MAWARNISGTAISDLILSTQYAVKGIKGAREASLPMKFHIIIIIIITYIYVNGALQMCYVHRSGNGLQTCALSLVTNTPEQQIIILSIKTVTV